MRGTEGLPVRLGFEKLGKVRFVSHRDVARAFERAFRIERLPLAFTQGFSPRPKVSFGLALSVGHESHAEYLDVELCEDHDVESLPERLTAALPEGIAVHGAVALVDRAPALQEAVTSVEYRVALAGLERETVHTAVEQVLASTEMSVTTTRKGKPVEVDVRASITRLAMVGDEAAIDLEVATKPRGTRPAEVISALRDLAGAPDPSGEDRVLRTRQWIDRDGELFDPLVADRRVTAPVGADARASEACA